MLLLNCDCCYCLSAPLIHSHCAGLVLLILYLYLCAHTSYYLHSAVIGELDDDRDASIDLSEVRAAPLKPLSHSGY